MTTIQLIEQVIGSMANAFGDPNLLTPGFVLIFAFLVLFATSGLGADGAVLIGVALFIVVAGYGLVPVWTLVLIGIAVAFIMLRAFKIFSGR